MSLPYHIGNGWFGGLTPLISQSVIAVTGHIFWGLAWPIGIALMTFIIGSLKLRETNHVRIWDEVDQIESEAALEAGQRAPAPAS
jgi:hypothetical protein